MVQKDKILLNKLAEIKSALNLLLFVKSFLKKYK